MIDIESPDSVNWTNISECQNLSENFIREFKDYVDWSNISRYQNLSDGLGKYFCLSKIIRRFY